jgi:hypothetical protein
MQPSGSPTEAYAPMIDGFNPPGRKKFISEASTKGVGPNGPSPTRALSLIAGQSTPRNLAKPTATAAIVPVCTTNSWVHPKRNAAPGPNASRR